MVSITCYGGVSEIGGNKILLNFESGSLFLDFGQSFSKEAQYFEEFLQPRTSSKLHDLLSLSLLPKLDGIYRQDAIKPNGFEDFNIEGKAYWETGLVSYEETIKSDGNFPEAVFISHAHADHCGYMAYLGNIPLFSSNTSFTMMKAISDVGNLSGFDDQLTEIKEKKINKLKSGYFPGELRSEYEKEATIRNPNFLEHNVVATTSSGISITGFDVDHSLPGSMACLVEAGDKQIVYSGDLRFHGRTGHNLGDDLDGLRPDVMLCEGTRINEQEPDNEFQVERDLTELISDCPELVMVGFAWKDLDRYETVKNAAVETGRIPVFDPRLAYLLARLGREIYDEDASVFFERTHSMFYSKGDYVNSKHKIGLIPCDDWDRKTKVSCTKHYDQGIKAIEIAENPDKYVLHLDYFRIKNLLDLNPPEGSIYVRAQCEPFNPRMSLSEERMMQWLRHYRINRENNFRPIQIHASGHASGPEIIEMLRKIEPRIVIPIHTKRPDLFEDQQWDTVIPAVGAPINLD